MRMRVCLFLMVALGTSITATGQQVQPAVPQPETQSVTSGSTELIEQGSYVNRDGVAVHDPAHTVSGAVPLGASAQCRDGSYSFSLHHSGTCSHHGGVSQWLK